MAVISTMNTQNYTTIKYLFLGGIVFGLNVFGTELTTITTPKATEEETFLPIHPNNTPRENKQILTSLDSLSTIPYFTLCASCKENEASTTEQETITSTTINSYKKRLKKLDQLSPFHLAYNEEVAWYINLYANKRKPSTEKLIGLSDVYFPLFEELLDKYDLPLEFKYLSVVESALNPAIKSHAGAVGLWQFMLNTGKSYGLNVNSYEDQRSDPYAATEAACKYFKDLYNIYHNWELVLAAYNCGPGNVNKAIKRSGYQKNYWKLWPYLPKETRGYVPAFIAVNYVMNYSKEHKMKAKMPHMTFFEFDTLQTKNRIDLAVVAKQLDIDLPVLTMLNPSYKKQIIPSTEDGRPIYLPALKIGDFIDKETSIVRQSKEKYRSAVPGKKKIKMVHHVLPGETIQLLSQKYGTKRHQLIKWNNLKSLELKPNQKIVVKFTDQLI